MSLRNLKEMTAERGITIGHLTVHRRALHFSPKRFERFNRKKRQGTRKWNLDETYVQVKGEWLFLYRAINSMAISSSSISAEPMT
ncbi:IS6 family transposase [Brucella pituitosa]|uniref:IS6 family transposase n=1 Tax=Brucella pituitosa TaxID=571256 RepID=A0ABS3K2Z7_9HYPH|nr:IS6 family transposase [Brucella pituitosa]